MHFNSEPLSSQLSNLQIFNTASLGMFVAETSCFAKVANLTQLLLVEGDLYTMKIFLWFDNEVKYF